MAAALLGSFPTRDALTHQQLVCLPAPTLALVLRVFLRKKKGCGSCRGCSGFSRWLHPHKHLPCSSPGEGINLALTDMALRPISPSPQGPDLTCNSCFQISFFESCFYLRSGVSLLLFGCPLPSAGVSHAVLWLADHCCLQLFPITNQSCPGTRNL